MQEMVCWWSIYIIHEGYNITITDFDANDKNEIMIIMINDVSRCSNCPIITNNNNNDNYIKTITIKFTITD